MITVGTHHTDVIMEEKNITGSVKTNLAVIKPKCSIFGSSQGIGNCQMSAASRSFEKTNKQEIAKICDSVEEERGQKRIKLRKKRQTNDS